MKNRRTWMFLLCGAGALGVAAIAMQATGTAESQTSSPAPVASATSSPLPANLPAGEIQSVTEHNGGRVIVIKAAEPVETAAPQQGMRAYIDPTTGRLREVTADDVKAEAAAAAAARLRSRTLAVATADATEVDTASGVAVSLDDSQMVYTVVHKDADGQVGIEHATGGDAAAKALAKPARKVKKEQRNDR